MLRIRLLGELELRWDDAPARSLESGRAESLLAYLLLHRSAPQQRQHLAFLLWPDSAEAQYVNLFHHIGQFLTAAGGDWRHVVRITFFVPDIAFRDACNPIWVEHFPDPASRPARHTQVVSGSKLATCEFIAYIDD